MNQIKQLWPEWEIVRVLGQGSFGSVYEIRRNLYGRIESAALKVISIPQSMQEVNELRNEGYDDRSITAHFQSYLEEIIREYTVMLDLKGHTNVVYCDDVRYVQREDGIGWDVFIKMELLTPLMNALHKEYDEAQVIRMGIDLCNALILCKNENIIHRDIKPQNIFVSKTGDCKLGDFGVAKISDKTVSGTKIGTYKYMAPEVYLNRPYGTSSDLYSLGLVLYWAMNERQTPFLCLPPQLPKPSEEEEARQRRFSGEAIPEPAHGTRGLKEIVLKACSYDPRDRFRDPAEMRDALIRLSAGGESRYEAQSEEEKTVGVFGVRTPPAPEKQPEEGTVGAFGNAVRQPAPVKEDRTVGAQPRQEEKSGKNFSNEELSELFSPYFGGKFTFGTSNDQKPEPAKQKPPVQKPVESSKQTPPVQKPVEPAKKQPKPSADKKKWIYFAAAAAAVLVILVIIISTMGKNSNQSSLQLTPKTMTDPVSVCSNTVAAVRNDGTVVYAGEDELIAEEVSTWTDIMSVYNGGSYVIGLKTDGSVVWTGSSIAVRSYKLDTWKDIVDMSVSDIYVAGLKSDGTVLSAGMPLLASEIESWTDIVEVEIGSSTLGVCVLGLKADGTVVGTGRDLYHNLDVEEWTDIVEIAADDVCTVGLRSNGSLVVATEYDLSMFYSGYYGQYLPKYKDWTNIVAIDMGTKRLVGLTVDGTVRETTDVSRTSGRQGPRELDIHGVDGMTDVAAVISDRDATFLLKNNGELLYYGAYEDLGAIFQETPQLFTNIALPRSVHDAVDKNAEHGTIIGEAWEANVLANFTENLDSVTNSSPAFGSENFSRGDIIAVFFLDSLRTLDEYGIMDTWDVSEKQDGSVLAGVIEDYNGMYQLYIAADGGINGSVACKGLFQSFTGLEAVSFENAFHTETTTDMSNMFYGCNNLLLVDCENLVTSNVTTMENMFSCCTRLETMVVSRFDTSKVENMDRMFHMCSSLSETVIRNAIESWDVSSVTSYEDFLLKSSYSSEDYLEFFAENAAQ